MVFYRLRHMKFLNIFSRKKQLHQSAGNETANFNDIILRGIEILESEIYLHDYEDVLEKLNTELKNLSLSFELYCFLPEVYCRLLIPTFKFSDTVVLAASEQDQKTMKLTQFDSYNIIAQIGESRFLSGKYKENIQKVIYTSSTLNALNNALNSGSKLEDLVGTPLILMIPEGYTPFIRDLP